MAESRPIPKPRTIFSDAADTVPLSMRSTNAPAPTPPPRPSVLARNNIPVPPPAPEPPMKASISTRNNIPVPPPAPEPPMKASISTRNNIPVPPPDPEPPMKVGYKDVDDMHPSHIRLFAPWMFDTTNTDIFDIYKGILTEGDIDCLQQAMQYEDRRLKDPKFFKAVHKVLANNKNPDDRNSPNDENVYKVRQIMKAFLEKSPHAALFQHKIRFTDCLPDAFYIYHNKMLENPRMPQMLDRICGMMHYHTILEQFKISSEATFRDIYEKFKNHVNVDTDEFIVKWQIRCNIMIELVTSHPKKLKADSWYYEFVKACNGCPRARAIAFTLEEDFLCVIAEYQVEIDRLSRPVIKPNEDLIDPNDIPLVGRKQEVFGKKPQDITGEFTANFQLRGYQDKLTDTAKTGQSTIICAPTGSGKTHVAAEIIVNHLRVQKHSDKLGRVAMFVPTIPLVTQQSTHLSSNLAPEFYVERLSGAERAQSKDNRKVSTILLADVVVLTPQIFINMICSPLKSQKLYIMDFSMLVFDECHHCDEAHPYNIVMNYVRQSDFKPQIIGLTASVSSTIDQNARLDAGQAIDLMLNLCARLNADTVTSVRKSDNLVEMYSHISKPLDEIMPPFKPSERDDFAHEVALICDYVQAEIGSTLQETLTDIADMKKEYIELPFEGHDGVNGKSKTSVSYNGKLGFLKQMISKKDINDDRRFFLLKCIEVLEICHFTLRNNELMPASIAFEYMCERMDDLNQLRNLEGGSNTKFQRYVMVIRKIVNHIREKYEFLIRLLPDSETKPILNALIGCIEEQYAKDRTSRIIIFVESRKGCVKMAEYFKKHSSIANTFGSDSVGYLVSVNQSLAKFGQSSAVQQQTLKHFRAGKIKILIATSVAEEGLDVAECNLIIKYNTVGSETSYIQRRGRARAKNSRSILLAIEARITEREFANIRKEFLMNECLKHVQAMNESELQRAIYDKKCGILMEMKNEEERLKRIDNDLYQLRCISCPIVICYSNQVSRLNDSQYVCCNPYSWKDSTIKERIKVLDSNKLSACCGEWICNCGQKRGEVIKFGEAYLPLIAADCFRLERKIGENNYQAIELKKQTTWKTIRSMYFTVGLIAPNQIRNMISALEDHNALSFQVAEDSETKGILESLKEDYKRKEKFVLKDSN